MDRQTRQLTVLSLVLLVIVAFVVMDQDRADRDRPTSDDAPASHDLFAYTSEQITHVKLTRPEGVLEFEKKEGEWAMTAPVSVGAESSKVDAIVDRFEGLRIEEAELGKNLGDYGLDDEHRTEVRLEKADGSAYTVYIGKDTAAGYKTYAQVPGDPAAHVVDNQVASLVSKAAEDFRDRNLLSFAAGGANRLTIEQGGAKTILRKDDSGWWVGDKGPRADAKVVEDYVSAITLMKVESFLDGKTLADEGLDNPFATVTVEDEGGTHTLRIATPDADGVSAAASDLPVRMKQADLDALLAPHAWPSTRLVEVKSWKVESVSLQLGDKKLEANRKDGAWKDGTGAEAKGLDDVVAVVVDLPVDRSATPAMAGKYGHVTLGLGAGKTVSIQIGDELTGGARGAQEDAGGPAFSVPKDTLALLQDAIDGKAKPKALPESPDAEEGAGGGLPPGMDIEELLRQAGAGGQ